MMRIPIHLADDHATEAFGRTLAATLKPGDLVLLEGDLGAGKTALARAVIRTLLGDDRLDVPSPSFSLVQPYDGDGVSVVHADLYRLASARELDELGLFDRTESIVIIEWPERAPELAGRANVRIRLNIPPSGEGRQVTTEILPGAM